MVIMVGVGDAKQSSMAKYVETLPSIANEMNKNLPMMIDKETRLDSVGAYDATLIFVYTLINKRAEEVTQDLKNFLYTQAINGYCTTMGEAKIYRDNNISLKIHYRDINGKFITDVTINASNCSLSSSSLSAASTATFRSSEYRFGFNYPREWRLEQPRLSGTVVKVVSPDGGLNFNVGAVWDQSLRNVHPKAFVKKFSRREITEVYKREFIKFRLLEAGETTLCNQPSYYVVYTHVWESLGRQALWKNMTVFSNRSGIQYTLTAGGNPKQFDKNLELIKTLFMSFVTDAPISQ